MLLAIAACGDNRALSSTADARVRDALVGDTAPDAASTSARDAAVPVPDATPAPDATPDAPEVVLVSLGVVNGDQDIRLGRTRQVSVFGHYSDDTFRDLTPSEQGTRYTVSQLDSIITCSKEGLISTLNLGFATLAVSNSGIVYSVSVEVVEPGPSAARPTEP